MADHPSEAAETEPEVVEKYDHESLLNYIQEVRNVKIFFEANKGDPPILPDHPKVAGKIWWMKSLFYPLKKTIVEFRKHEDVIETPTGEQAVREYLAFAKEMRAYGDNLFAEWSGHASKKMPSSLREHVFVSAPATEQDLGRNLSVAKSKNFYKVNLPQDILEMVQEVLLLEEMGGYHISELLRAISLQRDHYVANSHSLEDVVEKYCELRKELRPPEAQLCEKLFKQMDENFQQGAAHWNWAALGIPEYANTLNATVGRFEGVVSQINRIGRDVRFRVLGFKNVMLFKEPPYKTASYDLQTFDCWDYFQYWEKHRAKLWEKLLLQYRGLPPLFLKLETLIHNSSTGKLRSFRPYFLRWEKLIFRYMGKSIVRSLYEFEKRLLVPEPLFYIEAVLYARDIRLNPRPHEIFNLVMKGAKDCVDGSQKFIRWMRGTCTESPSVIQGGDQPPFIYSFYLEIGRIPRMLQLFLKIQENMQTILSNVWLHLKKYRKFKNLIRFNKDTTVKVFAKTNPAVDSYDDKLGFYTQIEQRIGEMPTYKIEGCVKLHLSPLLSAICRHAKEWVSKLGAALLISSRELVGEFDFIVSEYVRDVNVVPKDAEEMKRVLSTVQSVKNATINMEGLYRDIVRRYDVLKLYKIEYPQQDIDRLEEIWRKWQMLWLHEVKLVDKKLITLKKYLKD